MTRERLPNRRDNESREFEIEGIRCLVSVGFNYAGQPREIFINSIKPGSAVDALLSDTAVLVSLGLQAGTSPAEMAHSMSRLPSAPLMPKDLDKAGDNVAASVLGAAIDWLVELAEPMKGK